MYFIATGFTLCLMALVQGQQQEPEITLKGFLVAFSRNWNKFYVKSFKETYIYDVHTEGMVRSPEISLVFANSK